MDLDQQIADLIRNAPPDGTTLRAADLVAPVLKALAQRLGHLEYFLVQSLDGHWLVTTLSNRNQPEQEKTVVYAYPSLQAATISSQGLNSAQLCAQPLGVIAILFQLLALEGVDALVFFDRPDPLSQGTEIRRIDLQHLVQLQLEQRTGQKGFGPRSSPSPRRRRQGRPIPPNWA